MFFAEKYEEQALKIKYQPRIQQHFRFARFTAATPTAEKSGSENDDTNQLAMSNLYMAHLQCQIDHT